VRSLKEYLEEVISHGNLLKKTDGDLLVIIGNDSARDEDWETFFAVFEWRNDRLEKVEGLSW
jgi:hypothetical protein